MLSVLNEEYKPNERLNMVEKKIGNFLNYRDSKII